MNITENRAAQMVKVGEAKSIAAAKRKLRKMTDTEQGDYWLDVVEPKLWKATVRRS